MPITLVRGEVFASQAQMRVNSVTCRGVMGAGLAREVAQRDPTMFIRYRARCAAGQLRPGILHLYSGSVP